MNRFTIMLTLSFVISGMTFAQSRFLEGFIIDNNQDTLRGLIEYKGNQTNSQVCIFKENEQSVPITYNPHEISGYRYGESRYYISKGAYLNGQKQTMFLEFLVDGVVDVFCYYENNNAHYLIQTDKDSLIELKSVKKVISSIDAKDMQGRSTYYKGGADKYVYESKTYKYVLKDIFKASPKVASKADQAVLDHASLINLASSYHKEMCPDEECIIYKKGRDGHVKAGIMIGLGIVTLSKPPRSNDINDYYLAHCDFVSNVYPSLGFFILAGLPGINANMHFQFEGSVNQLKFETSGSAVQNGSTFNHEIEFSQTCLNANAVLKYAIGEKNVKPIIQAGGFLNFGVGESFHRESEISNIVFTYDLSPFNAMDLGLIAGTGLMLETVKKKAIVIDLRYRWGLTFVENAYANYFTLGVGFQL